MIVSAGVAPAAAASTGGTGGAAVGPTGGAAAGVGAGTGSVAATASSVDLRVTLDREWGAPYSPNATVGIWVGAADGSGPTASPESDVPVNVTVTGPDDAVLWSSQNRTGPDGNVFVPYDLDDARFGRYDVTVTSPETGDVARTTFDVEYRLDIDPHSQLAAPGEPVGVNLHVARDRYEPVAGATFPVEIVAPNGTRSRSVTTGPGGFAGVTIHTADPGTYHLDSSAEKLSGLVFDVDAAELRTRMDVPSAWRWPVSETVPVTGYVANGSGLLANETLVVDVIDERNDSVAATLRAETDRFGQYDADWTPVAPGDYRFRFSTADGTPVAATENDVSAANLSGPPSSAGGLAVDPSFADRTVAPGGTATLTVEVTHDGTAVAGETVTVAAAYRGEVPAHRTTVTTDQNGVATATIPVDPDAPLVEFGGLAVTAAATVNGTTAMGTTEVNVRRYDVSTDLEGESRPGENVSVNYEVHNVSTGAAVEGFPVVVGAYSHTAPHHVSALGGGAATTNAQGEADVSFELPRDVRYQVWLESNTRGAEFSYLTPVERFPVDVAGLNRTYEAGDSLSVSYSADAGEPTKAVVAVTTYEDGTDPVLTTERVGPGEEVTATVPADAPEGFYQVEVRALTADGNLSVDTVGFEVVENASSPPPSPSLPSPCGTCGTPTDPDGDGRYEDLNGNGALDFEDVVVLFERLESGPVQDNPSAYDFNGNGRVDFDDVVTLFEAR